LNAIDLNQKIEYYDKSIELDPNYWNAFYNKGNLLLELNKNEEAIVCYNKVIELKQSNSDVYYNKANALKNLNKFQDAIECYNTAFLPLIIQKGYDPNEWINLMMTENKQQPPEQQKPLDQQHIMISYNKESRDMCMKFKKSLELKLNRKFWIDVEDMHGDTMTAMANAVEQASCVIICMTEKYYQSVNTKFEADYVVSLKKPFIPLIMQEGYKPTGWYLNLNHIIFWPFRLIFYERS